MNQKLPSLGGKAKDFRLTIILATIFVDYLSPALVIPLLPLYAKQFGASPTTIGLLFAVFPMISFILTPIWSALSDHIGRKPIIALGLLGTTLSLTLYGLSKSLIMLFVARACTGVAGANIATATAYVTDITDKKERAAAMGRVGAVASSAWIIAPAIGGIWGSEDIGRPFLIAAGFALLNFCSALLLLPESLPREKRTHHFSLKFFAGSARKLLKLPRLRNLFLIAFLATVKTAVGSAMLSLFLDARFSLTVREISFLFVGTAVFSTLSQYVLVGVLVKRFGENSLLRAVPAFSAIACVAVALSPTFPVFICIWILMTAFEPLFFPVLNSLTSKQARDDEYGLVFGLLISAGLFARIIGPPLGGFAFQTWGAISQWFVMASLMIMVLLLALLGLKKPNGLKEEHADLQKNEVATPTPQ
jgi:MFS family permease